MLLQDDALLLLYILHTYIYVVAKENYYWKQWLRLCVVAENNVVIVA